jgi:hypothetical protein
MTYGALNKIKTLVDEYFELPKNHLIDNHTELIKVAENINTKHKKHPHRNTTVYISRMGIKHVVEERSWDLLKNHSTKEALPKIHFAVSQIPETIINFDRYEYEPNGEKHFFVKHYSNGPSLRILCDLKNTSLEIKSVHFRKSKKEASNLAIID